MTDPLLLAIDQGTTSTRAMLFDAGGGVRRVEQRELPQSYPGDGMVEHDAEGIWRDVLHTARTALDGAEGVAAIGIANQRETAVVWERDTGRPIHPAIVWQDRRTAGACERLRAEGAEDLVRARTGLLLDPYFSATKLAWVLDNVDGARTAAERGRLCFGTVDSFLLFRLTGGAVHATDAANASRTLLFDIHRQCWDPELLRLFRVPEAMLPEVKDNAGVFGNTAPGVLGRSLPVSGMAGDQQAALVGQGCLAPGGTKATFGTGCFALCHTGERAVESAHRMLCTVASRLDGRVAYAVEGAIFVAGAAVQWLRDGLGVIGSAADTEALAASVPDGHGVYLVPGFVGLGAPHWRPDARGLLCGLTRDTGPAHLARAALESVAFQTLDLVGAMEADAGVRAPALRIDGGMAANGWFCQFLADVLERPVERPAVLETTAWGAALLAGLGAGVLPGLDAGWRAERRFEPRMAPALRERLVAGWRGALARTLLEPGRS